MFKNIKLYSLVVCILILSSCSNDNSSTSKLSRAEVSYYKDKNVKPIDVPPDLTKPNAAKPGLENFGQTVDFKTGSIQSKRVLNKPDSIEVNKLDNIYWLTIDQGEEKVWQLVEEFLITNGLSIEKSERKTGMIETGFVEFNPNVPEESLGLIRSMLKKALNQKFSTNIIHKYRVRIEPSLQKNKTEVYLSLIVMEEVLAGKKSTNDIKIKSKIWGYREKDLDIELNMLYKLMFFLGENEKSAQQKIKNPVEDKKIDVNVVSNDKQTNLIFNLDSKETWLKIGWALDQLNIDVEDRDSFENTYYIQIDGKTKGIFSNLFGKRNKETISYQIIVKYLGNKKSQVMLHDLTDKYDAPFLEFQKEILEKIAKLF